MGSTVFLLNSHFIKKIVEPGKQKYATIILLALFIVFGFAALSAGSYHTSDFRYLNAISPFFSPKTSFTEIVAEHQVPTFVDFFTYHSVVLFFAGLGVWIAFSRKKETYIFALILAILGVYVSSGLVRLLVYSTIGIIILAGIALAEITRAILQKESARFRATKRSHTIGSQDNIKSRTKDWAVSISYICIIIFILLIPLLYPTNSNWLSLADYPPTIIGSPDSSTETSNDWLYALNWISNHTPKNAVIAAWWDYGYWITTMGNRTSLADNATINQTKIATIAKMFIESPEKGLQIAHELKADYILIYVVAHPVLINGKQLYVLGSGGDESIVPSMIGLSRLDESKYISKNVFTDQFWNSTLIGNLIPFERKGYVDRENLQNATLFQEFKQGYSPVYEKAIKFPATSTVNNDSLNLVYSSPSFEKAYDKNNLQNSTINTVLIYQMT
jgi:dolichyl-diphosphooligosaccharide--protein glycosyltransferase